MPVRGCPETPDSRSKRCSKHPIKAGESAAAGTSVGEDASLCCEVCHLSTGASTMLLCGDDYGHGCGDGYHIACLRPPLASVPDGAWFCGSCAQQPKTADDAARRDAVVGRVTRSQTRLAQEQKDTWEVEKLVDTHTDAKVRHLREPDTSAGGPGRAVCAPPPGVWVAQSRGWGVSCPPGCPYKRSPHYTRM